MAFLIEIKIKNSVIFSITLWGDYLLFFSNWSFHIHITTLIRFSLTGCRNNRSWTNWWRFEYSKKSARRNIQPTAGSPPWGQGNHWARSDSWSKCWRWRHALPWPNGLSKTWCKRLVLITYIWSAQRHFFALKRSNSIRYEFWEAYGAGAQREDVVCLILIGGLNLHNPRF